MIRLKKLLVVVVFLFIGNTFLGGMKVSAQQMTCPPDIIAGVCKAGSIYLGYPNYDRGGCDECGRVNITNDKPEIFSAGITIVTWHAIGDYYLYSTYGQILASCEQKVTITITDVFDVGPSGHVGPWGHNFLSIQSAIDEACDGDTVIVYPGTYVERIGFKGKAITVRSIDPNDPAVVASTIIDGNGAGHVVTFGQKEGSNSVLNGFTIQNGKGHFVGGGIFCISSSPTITNCIISKNLANGAPNTSDGGEGGGIYCQSSSPIITNCTISENSSGGGAAGYSEGGGIFCISSSPTITNCIISKNLADGSGGGIYCQSSSPTITNCIISKNSASGSGGGICGWSGFTITNCTISGNSARYGGGIECGGDSTTITNCILWNNLPHEITNAYNSVITYSDIKGGCSGTGNIKADPLFVNPDEGDYHLQSGSPCIDAGISDGAPATDKDGNPRDSNPDMGAYEFESSPLPPTPPGITVTPATGLETTEDGGNAEFTVVLNTEPAANVIIDISSSDLTEGGRSPLSITFTPDNWDIPQTVTVYGLDDDTVDGDMAYTIITEPAESDDTDYNGLDADDVSAINRDNDSYPTVVNHTPIDSANVPTDTAITIEFSKSMNKYAVENTFHIVPIVPDPIVPEIVGNFTWSNNDRTFTFIPSSRFLQTQQYTVCILAAYDTEGNRLQTVYTFSFTTQRDLWILGWTEISGNFFENWFEAQSGFIQENPTVPLHVRVEDVYFQPIAGATISIDGKIYGQTEAGGHLKILYPIPNPPIAGEHSVIVKVATTSGLTAESESIVLYNLPQPCVRHSKTLTKGDVFDIWCKLMEDTPPTIDIPLRAEINIPWLSLIMSLIRTLEINSQYREGDIWTMEAYRNINTPDVKPAWLIRQTMVRDGQCLVDMSSWTENETVFNETFDKLVDAIVYERAIKTMLASPAVLYVTAPDGSHAGYDPITGELVMDFPIAISKPGEEPFYLIIPSPVEGEYITTVVGTGVGNYTLSIQASDSEGVKGEEFIITGSITTGETHKYDMIMTAPTAGEDAIIEYVEPIVLGDVDGNKVPNQADFTFLLAHKGQPASACLKCDLNGDGKITVSDLRKMVLQCPGCVFP